MRSIGGHEGLISIAADVAVAMHRCSTLGEQRPHT
jgi:hypothetical protein